MGLVSGTSSSFQGSNSFAVLNYTTFINLNHAKQTLSPWEPENVNYLPMALKAESLPGVSELSQVLTEAFAIETVSINTSHLSTAWASVAGFQLGSTECVKKLLTS